MTSGGLLVDGLPLLQMPPRYQCYECATGVSPGNYVIGSTEPDVCPPPVDVVYYPCVSKIIVGKEFIPTWCPADLEVSTELTRAYQFNTTADATLYNWYTT